MVNAFETNRTNTITSGRVETLRHDRLDYVTDPDLTRPGELLVRNKAWSSRVVESGEGGVHCGAIKVGFEWVTQLTFSIILGAPRRTR